MKYPQDLQCTIKALQESIFHNFKYYRAKSLEDISRDDVFPSLASAVRDRLIDAYLSTEKRYRRNGSKRIYYLSMEFLMGRLLGNNLMNLGIYDAARDALEEMGYDLEEVREMERDAALGNGGLGRLAACFLDSMATLGIAGFGYGINYEFGLFRQEIKDGFQVERPDSWFASESPWIIKRPENVQLAPIYGKVYHEKDRAGNYNPMWLDWNLVIGMPYDIPVVGFGGQTVNCLRLYAAIPSSEFDMAIFNEGDYINAVRQKIDSETISKILYPMDTFEHGRELRLIQEYFLVTCTLQDIMKNFLRVTDDLKKLPEMISIHMNDTHPALSVVELMRILVDEKGMDWDTAWDITVRTLAFTNHTLLPESLESWPVHLMEKVLPRHLQIIYEINHRMLMNVGRVWPGDDFRIQRMSIIQEQPVKGIRMLNLAVIGSHSVNGVSALHSELVKKNLLSDFFQMWPERFNNKTNGVTPRRWLLKANPILSGKITESIGDAWITDLDELRRLEKYKDDVVFLADINEIKRKNKERLGRVIQELSGKKIDPDSIFDIQAKRFHEYKRQLLNALRIIHDYLLIIEDGVEPPVPRTYIFSGKAAPGYWQAKLHIKLINNLSNLIDRDKKASRFMNVVFLPDYRVSLAEKIIPAADLSEQISTAGMEASGTGNMKFALNGALTLGTYDGANIEILEEVGEENIFIFGLRSEEIEKLRRSGYDPWAYYHSDAHIKRAMDFLQDDRLSQDRPGIE